MLRDVPVKVWKEARGHNMDKSREPLIKPGSLDLHLAFGSHFGGKTITAATTTTNHQQQVLFRCCSCLSTPCWEERYGMTAKIKSFLLLVKLWVSNGGWLLRPGANNLRGVHAGWRANDFTQERFRQLPNPSPKRCLNNLWSKAVKSRGRISRK